MQPSDVAVIVKPWKRAALPLPPRDRPDNATYSVGKVHAMLRAGYLYARSAIEESGDVNSEAFAGVLDLERALDALEAQEGALAALAVLGLVHGLNAEEMRAAFMEHDLGWKGLVRRSARFMALYLSGSEDD